MRFEDRATIADLMALYCERVDEYDIERELARARYEPTMAGLVGQVVGGIRGCVADLQVADAVHPDERLRALATPVQVQRVHEHDRVVGARLVHRRQRRGQRADLGETHELQSDPGVGTVRGRGQAGQVGDGVGVGRVLAHGQQEPGAEGVGQFEEPQVVVERAVRAQPDHLQVEQRQAQVGGLAAERPGVRDGRRGGVDPQARGVVARLRRGRKDGGGRRVEDGACGERDHRTPATANNPSTVSCAGTGTPCAAPSRATAPPMLDSSVRLPLRTSVHIEV